MRFFKRRWPPNAAATNSVPEQTLIRSREFRRYLLDLGDSYPERVAHAGWLAVRAFEDTTQHSKKLGGHAALILLNLNITHPEEATYDHDMKRVLDEMPGAVTSQGNEDCTQAHAVYVTSEIGNQAIKFTRSHVPDQIPGRDMRVIYAMTSDLI